MQIRYAYELVRVVVRQRLQQERVNGREDGRGGSNSQSESDNNSQSEPTIAAQLAHAIANVLPEELRTCSGSVVAHSLLHLFNAAELRHCCAAGLGWRHTGSDSLIDHHIDIGTYLIV